MKSALRTAGIVAVVLAVAFGYVCPAENKDCAPKTGTEAPGFRLPSLAGEGEPKGQLSVRLHGAFPQPFDER